MRRKRPPHQWMPIRDEPPQCLGGSSWIGRGLRFTQPMRRVFSQRGPELLRQFVEDLRLTALVWVAAGRPVRRVADVTVNVSVPVSPCCSVDHVEVEPMQQQRCQSRLETGVAAVRTRECRGRAQAGRGVEPREAISVLAHPPQLIAEHLQVADPDETHVERSREGLQPSQRIRAGAQRCESLHFSLVVDLPPVAVVDELAMHALAVHSGAG